jgi:hypothetical protein
MSENPKNRFGLLEILFTQSYSGFCGEGYNISKSEKQGQAMRGDIFGVRGVGGLQILQSKLQYL